MKDFALGINLTHVFLVMHWRLIFIASFSAAVPLESSTDNRLALFDSNGFAGSPVDTSKGLAFNLDPNQGSSSNLNSGVSGITSEVTSGTTSDINTGISPGISGINIPDINPGIPVTSNPNGDSTVFSFNYQDSSVPLDEKNAVSSSKSEFDSNNDIDDPVTPDSATDTDPLIIAQNAGSSCPVPERLECPNPDNFLRRPPSSRANPQTYPGRDVARRYLKQLLEKDDTFMESFTHYPTDMGRVCRSYRQDGSVRALPVCCLGPTDIISMSTTGLTVSNEGNCVTYVPNRPRCMNHKRRFCCADALDVMALGYQAFNCVLMH